MTLLSAARRLGEDRPDGGGHGIETLIVFLGANNALQTVTQLKVEWSGEGYDDLERKKAYTVWDPSHFKEELRHIAAQVRQIAARHVIWCTVPHVTIPRSPVESGPRALRGPGTSRTTPGPGSTTTPSTPSFTLT